MLHSPPPLTQQSDDVLHPLRGELLISAEFLCEIINCELIAAKRGSSSFSTAHSVVACHRVGNNRSPGDQNRSYTKTAH